MGSRRIGVEEGHRPRRKDIFTALVIDKKRPTRLGADDQNMDDLDDL